MSRFQELLSQKELRDGRRYRQTEIAAAIGVSNSTITRWLQSRDVSSSSVLVALKLAAWLGCKVGDLVYIEDGEVA